MKQHHVTFKARRNHGLPLSPITVTVSVRGKPTPEQVHDKAMRALLKQFPGTCGSQWYTRELLVEEIRAHGYAVEFRSFCEDGETPGILGQFAGLTIHNRKAVKIATTGRSDAMILAILAHELEHVEGAERGTDYPELGLRCGGTISKGVSAADDAELKALAYRLYRDDEIAGNGLWTGMPCEFDQMWPPHQERYLAEAKAQLTRCAP